MFYESNELMSHEPMHSQYSNNLGLGLGNCTNSLTH